MVAGLNITPSQAQVNMKKVGQSTMGFLQVGVSARAASLGNAYTALGTGAESIFYNPAGIADQAATFSGFASITQWIADISYYGGSATWRISNIGVFGAHFLSVDYGTVHGTRLLTVQEAGVNPLGYEETGNVNMGAYSVGLSYARQISDRFTMGGTLSLASQRLGENEISGSTRENSVTKVVANFGLRYYPGLTESFRISMYMRNFSNNVTYEEVATSLPLILSMGVAMDLFDATGSSSSRSSSLLLSTEFMHVNNYTERVNVGLEYGFAGLFFLRGGYEFNYDLAGLSAGFGVVPTINGTDLHISYAYSDFDLFKGVHRFSLNVDF